MLTRKAKSEELNSILDFQLALARETENIELEHSTVKKGITAVFKDPVRGSYFVAIEKGKVIGSLLTTYEWSDWRNGMILWIQSVYVIPKFRRKGVYSSLYLHIKKMVQKDTKLKGIRLYTDKSNIVASKAYEKLGMNSDHYITFEWLK
jgi:ribosomal protein S18 acetylase RimI-like enzyme